MYVVAQITSLSSDLVTDLAAIRSDARQQVSDKEASGRFVGILASDEQRILV